MDWLQVAGIVLGSGLFTTLLTQAFQRGENRYDPRREAYVQLRAALTAFERTATQHHELISTEPVDLKKILSEMISEDSPLDAPLASVQLLATKRTYEAANLAVQVHYAYFVRHADLAAIHEFNRKLFMSMRRDLRSVA